MTVIPKSRPGRRRSEGIPRRVPYAATSTHSERPEDERERAVRRRSRDGRDGDLARHRGTFAAGARGKSEPVGHHGDFAGEEKVAGLRRVEFRRLGDGRGRVADNAAIEIEAKAQSGVVRNGRPAGVGQLAAAAPQLAGRSRRGCCGLGKRQKRFHMACTGSVKKRAVCSNSSQVEGRCEVAEELCMKFLAHLAGSANRSVLINEALRVRRATEWN